MIKAIQENFYGDNTRWFIGVVVNHTPPIGLEGRVQIRINGIHSPSTDDVPQRDLPWAQVTLPATEEGTSGLGKIPKIMTGAQVFGIFVDGVASQVPLVLGSIPKIENETPIQIRKGIDKPEYDYIVGQEDRYGYIDSQEELFAEFKNIKREVTEVVVHWSETYSNKDIGAEELDTMQSGNIGYHYVIRRDGTIQRGLPVNQQGDHTQSTHDERSIGVIFIGGFTVASGSRNPTLYESANSLTRSQLNSFESLIAAFYKVYPGGQVIGHNDLDDTHNDPGFDVRSYCRNIFGKKSLFDSGVITRGPLTPEEINTQKINVTYTPSVTNTSAVSGVLDFIAKYESGGSYIAVYPNTTKPSILSMTLNELIADMVIRGNTTGSSASGRYQFIRTTLISVANQLSYDFDIQTYNEDTQDKLCIKLLESTCSLDSWLSGAITSREFMIKLSRQWASIPDPDTGVSHYSGVLDNAAGVSVTAALSQLDTLQGIA